MRNRTRFWATLLSLPILAGLSLPALADRDHDHDHHDHDRHDGRDFHEHHRFHGRDFRFFTAFELDLWRGGHWRHEWHDGRFGWWWFADGGWYWYPEPAYPYPTYVSPPLVIEAPPPPPPAPVVVSQPPPPPPAPVAGAPPAQFWYFCEESRAYYPYVATCASPWRQVAPTPAVSQ